MAGRILALDIGTKRTGVAVSDESGTIAFPVTVVEARNPKDWADKLAKLISDYENLETVVVGMPLNHQGEAGRDAENIRRYIALLRDRAQVPVVEWDERFTTVQAERTLLEADISRRDRKERIDKIAAAILLQTYLDRLHFESTFSEE